MKSILVASENPSAVETIRDSFHHEYRIDVARGPEECLELFRRKRCEFLFIDVTLLQRLQPSPAGAADYRLSLSVLWQTYPTAQIIVMASQERIRDAVMAVKAGAGNYVTFPISREELRHVTETVYKTILMKSELNYLREKIWQSDSLEIVNTESPVMREVFDKVKAVASMKTTVLLTGETGTGKGTLAKLIHRCSNRAKAQLIHVHCGAIQDTLLESELFGHEKGAFTGADRRKLGKFEIAHKGTIFLDEIGTLTHAAQIRLLQVLQEQTIQRVGGEAELPVDVRVIAATNSNLEDMVERGDFRNDLYYRLSVFPVEVPPLRDRREDIPFLADSFLRELNRTNAKEIRDIDPRVLDAFTRYPWPGNIREMKNLMERAYVIEKSSMLTPASFPGELFQKGRPENSEPPDNGKTLGEVKSEAVRKYLEKTLSRHEGRIQETAEAAGITTRQLHKLMTRYGLRKEIYKKSGF
jgi:DNA-binding NtrC family response regulator